jgi:hypothetical protein
MFLRKERDSTYFDLLYISSCTFIQMFLDKAKAVVRFLVSHKLKTTKQENTLFKR